MEREVQFAVTHPVDAECLRANVRHALSLGLPELRDFEYPRIAPLHIVANGPSARIPDGSCMALNGALRLWRERAEGPMYWAACDPQPLVASFLPANPPRNTIYLVASKCDPAVFAKLRGCNVFLWHVHEDETADLLADRSRIGAGVSVTNCAPELATYLGYRLFHVWGWDGCFAPDGASHRGDGETASERVTIQVAERSFFSTHTWGLELLDAEARLIGFPFPLHIHGDGMFAAHLRDRFPNRVTID